MQTNGTDNLLMDFLDLLNRLKEQLYTINITPFKQELVIIARQLDRREKILDQQTAAAYANNSTSLKRRQKLNKTKSILASDRDIYRHIDQILELAEIAFNSDDFEKITHYHRTLINAIGNLIAKLEAIQRIEAKQAQQQPTN